MQHELSENAPADLNTPQPTQKLLTVAETAALLRKSESWVRRHESELPVVRLVSSVCFDAMLLHRMISGTMRDREPLSSSRRKESSVQIQRYQNGHVYKRGKKKKVWYGRYREDCVKASGEIVRRTKNVRLGTLEELPTKAAAVLRLQEKIALQGPRQTMSFSELHKRWEIAELPTIKRNTAAYYQKLLRCHLLPTFGGRELPQISRESVQTFLASESQKYARSTLKGMRIALGRVLGWAVDCGWLDKNPCSKVPLPRVERPKRGRIVLSAEQVAQISSNLPEPYATLVLFLATTGLRIGEAIGIRWSDLQGDVLHVSRTIYEGKADSTKSKASNRKLPIPAALIERMRTLGNGEYIFRSRTGTPINPGNALKRYLRPAAEKVGIALSGWHDFRHTLATQLLRGGSSPKVVSSILGHSDVDITLNVYEHVETDVFRSPLEKMAGQLLPTVTKSLAVAGSEA